MTIDCSKLQPGTICVTRYGHEVEYIGKSNFNNVKFPYIFFSICTGTIVCNSMGLYDRSDELSCYDIISIKKPKRALDCWVNVYNKMGKMEVDGGFDMKMQANAHAESLKQHRRIACLHIVQEYEEGEGLS